MYNTKLFFLALLIVLWWVSVWGLVETFLQPFIKGSPSRALAVYGTLFVSVAAILVFFPELLEHFV